MCQSTKKATKNQHKMHQSAEKPTNKDQDKTHQSAKKNEQRSG